MKYLILDVAVYDSYAVFGIFIAALFLIGCVLLEAFVILGFNKFLSFKQSFFTSLFINLITTVIGIVLIPVLEDVNLISGYGDGSRLGVLFLITFVLEALLLKQFRKTLVWRNVVLTSLVMNLVTYAILFSLFGLSN